MSTLSFRCVWLGAVCVSTGLTCLAISGKSQAQLRISAVWPYWGLVEIVNTGQSPIALSQIQILTSDLSHPNRTSFTLGTAGFLESNHELVLSSTDTHGCVTNFGCIFVDPAATGFPGFPETFVSAPDAVGPYSIGVTVGGTIHAFFQFTALNSLPADFSSQAATMATNAGIWTNPNDSFRFWSGHAVISPTTRDPKGPGDFAGSVLPEPSSLSLLTIVAIFGSMRRFIRRGDCPIHGQAVF